MRHATALPSVVAFCNTSAVHGLRLRSNDERVLKCERGGLRLPRRRQCVQQVSYSAQACAKPERARTGAEPTNAQVDDPRPETGASRVQRVIERATSMFPVWVVLGALTALVHPPAFLWFRPRLITIVLGVVMAGMGLTLSLDDFSTVLARPRTVVLGVCAQYGIMPFLGFAIGKLFRLPVDLAVGLTLVAVCPGGAASNLVCLIGKADVALSVVLTLCSTLLSIFAIPVLMQLLAGTLVPLSPGALLLSTVQVVLFPLAFGLSMKVLAPQLVEKAVLVLPLVSVIGVTLICGSIVASNSAALLSSVGSLMIVALSVLHGMGGLLGYYSARASGLPARSSRTVSIEVMMQNSSLAVALAIAHFSSPLTAVPGAVSATMHSVMGSILAGIWRLSDGRKRHAQLHRPKQP